MALNLCCHSTNAWFPLSYAPNYPQSYCFSRRKCFINIDRKIYKKKKNIAYREILSISPPHSYRHDQKSRINESLRKNMSGAIVKCLKFLVIFYCLSVLENGKFCNAKKKDEKRVKNGSA